jgi:hypothetical protein
MTYNTIEPIVSKNEGQLKDKEMETETETEPEPETKEERKYRKHANDYVSTTIWYENPALLFSSNSITELYPKENMSQEQKINAITRVILLLTVLGFVFLNNTNILISGLIAIGILIFLYNIIKKRNVSNKMRETFSNSDAYDQVKHNFTNPTQVNPTMNVLLPEIQDNPNRLDAAPSYKKPVVDKINEETKKFILSNFDNPQNIREKLFNSGANEFDSNNFDFEQSMRQFYTTANTKIPNNQEAFAKFCYGNMASCRDGDVEMCSRNIPRHIMS